MGSVVAFIFAGDLGDLFLLFFLLRVVFLRARSRFEMPEDGPPDVERDPGFDSVVVLSFGFSEGCAHFERRTTPATIAKP